MRLSITEPQLEGADIGDMVYTAEDLPVFGIGSIPKGTTVVISGFDPGEQEVGVDVTVDEKERTIWRHPNYFTTTRPFSLGDEVSEDEIRNLPARTIIVQNHTNKAWQVNDKGLVNVVGNIATYNPEGLSGIIVWMP